MIKKITDEELMSIISKEELYNLYVIQNKNRNEVCKSLNISTVILDKLLHKYNIEKAKEHSFTITKEQLYQDYIIDNMKLKDVAKKYNVCIGCVIEKLAKFSIKKDRALIIKNNSKYTNIDPNQLRELYINKNMAASEISKILGISPTHIQRLLKKFNIIKTPEQFKEMQIRINNEIYARRTEEQRQHKVEALKTWWANKTPEQKEKDMQGFYRANKNRTPEHQAKLVASFKKYMANETDEEKAERIRKVSEGTKKAMTNMSEEKVFEMIKKRNKALAERTPEQKKATIEKCKRTWINGSKEKLIQTNLKRYGVKWVSQTEEFKNKAWASKKANGTANTSKPENKIAFLLSMKYKNTLRNYKSDLYPFHCDFYIPELDLYIEYQGHPGHGKEPFNSNNQKHIEILNEWKERAKIRESKLKKRSQYSDYIKIWTIRDPLKRKVAKRNNLNWIEFFNMEQFFAWYKTQKGLPLLEYKSSIK